MTERQGFSLYDGLICKRCNRLFSLGRSDQLINGLRFPKNDLSIIEAKCPRCFTQLTYNENDLWRDNKDEESELVKQLRSQLAQVTTEKDVIKKMYEQLIFQIKEHMQNSSQPPKPTDTQMQPVG